MPSKGIVRAFDFQGRSVRVELFDGEPWWVAKDVLAALGYAEGYNPSRALEHVPEEWRGVYSMNTLGGMQEMLCLSEQGLYFFLSRSDKPTVLPFQKWIAGEVVPSIRRTGKFEMMPLDPTVLGLPDFTDPPEAALAWAKEYKGRVAAEAQVKKLEAKIVEDAPRLDFATSVEASETSYLVGQVAKIIKRGTGVSIGQNRFFAWLRDHGYVHKGGVQHNEPTQRTQDRGLMFVSEHVSTTRDGKAMVTRTPRITGKGKLFFFEQFHRLSIKCGLASQAVTLPMAQQDLFALVLPSDDIIA